MGFQIHPQLLLFSFQCLDRNGEGVFNAKDDTPNAFCPSRSSKRKRNE